MLTVIIPTKNEEKFLPTCLKSVAFADEILVIDSGSTDKTLDIAKKAGATIHHEDWQGFTHVHNLGAKKASGDWLLYVDADERVSTKLKNEIIKTLTQPQSDAYQIPRLNYFMGKPLKHGGWYPDLMTRLIKKSNLDKWVGELHEYPIIKGTTGQLKHDLYHLSHRDMEWKLQKSISYTQLNAKLMYEAGHPPVKLKNFIGAMAREFYLRAIKKSGWRDGFIGWLEIIDQTFNAFLTQVFLWQLQQKRSLPDTYQAIDQQITQEISKQ